MFKRIDRSQFLSKLLERLSGLLARQRGLPILIGIVCVVIAFVLQLLNFAAGSRVIEIVATVLHSGGVLVALIGILLAEPLGR